MKRLIVDAQVFQTPAWHRGMGKYSLELVRSMVKDNEKTSAWKEIVVILSDQMKIDHELRRELASIKHITVEILNLVPNDILNPATSLESNHKVIDAFIGDGKDDVFLILSLMQSEVSPVYPSSNLVHKSVLFYDLIPFMFHRTYLKNPITQKEYLSKVGELIKSDSFLAISKTVANDLAIYLGIPPFMVTSIDGGPIQHDTKEEAYDIPGPFILMPTGNDLRKNNRRAIEAFDSFNRHHDNKYTLVVTSFFKPEEIVSLRSLTTNVVFTGNVSGSQLNFLYEHADLVLFPSEYEGLGLPVLEALAHQTPVVCSDISVFREISRTAFTYFDPTHIKSITDALEIGITSTIDKEEVSSILAKYNWENTAVTARLFLSRALARHPRNTTKLRFASPDAAGQERGVGKLITQLHASLQARFPITYYQEKDSTTENIEQRPSVLPFITSFEYINKNGAIFVEKPDQMTCYHITDSASCTRILMGALANPGIVILHDLELKTLWRSLLKEGLISKERYDLEGQLTELYKAKGLASLLAASRGVIVFSSQAEKIIAGIINKLGTSTEVTLIPLPANGLVYDDVAPMVTSQSLSIDDLKGFDDMQYENAISYCSEIIVKKDSLRTDTLLAKVETAKYHPRRIKESLSDYALFTDRLEAFINRIIEKEDHEKDS